MFIIVLQREFHFSCDHHRATAPSLTGTAINRRHRIRTCLKKDYSLSNLLDIRVSINEQIIKIEGRDSYKYNRTTKEQFFLIFTPRLDKDARVARCPECNPESMSSTSITVWLDPARDPAPMIGVLHASDKLLPSSAKATYQLINQDFLQFKEILNI